jgi:hypothetical protein
LNYTTIPVFEYYFKKSGKNTILLYRWNTDEKKFNLPVWIEVENKKMLIPCQTKFKKKVLGEISTDVVRVMTELQYIDSKKIK